MKLSQLVDYKNYLDSMSVEQAKNQAEFSLNVITEFIRDRQTEHGGTVAEQLSDQQVVINSAFNDFASTLDQLKIKLENEISQAEKPWIQESYKVYRDSYNYESQDELFARNLHYSDEVIQDLRARLKTYADWRYPGLILRPALDPFINDMLALDPLYIGDTSYDYLYPLLDNYSETYQRRLRLCVIDEFDTGENEFQENYLTNIPKQQIGLCFANNFFNFKPFEVFKCYSTEIFEKLRPGGIFVMTFNDCSRRSAVELVESAAAVYTTLKLVQGFAEALGFETVYKYNDEGPTTWIEFKKPGTLNSLRGGQTLAKMVRIKNNMPVDTVKEKVYTSEEIEKLKQQAIDLNIDSVTVFEPSTLEYLINQRRKNQ